MTKKNNNKKTKLSQIVSFWLRFITVFKHFIPIFTSCKTYVCWLLESWWVNHTMIKTNDFIFTQWCFQVHNQNKKLMISQPNEITSLELANIKNTIMFFVCPSKIMHKHCFYFLLGLTMIPRESGNNAYAKFWRDKQRVYCGIFWYWLILILQWRFSLKNGLHN